jgi:hypothetical protein
VSSERPYTIPDFEADEAVRAKYQAVARDLVNLAVARGVESARLEYQALYLQFLAASTEAEAVQRKATVAAQRARAKYAAVVPHQRTASGIVRPPTFFFDIIASMGAAEKFYNDAIATAKAKNDADAVVRLAHGNLERIKNKGDAAVVVRELEIRRHFKTPEGRRELDADARLHGLALQCAEIDAERLDFQERLDAGAVSDEELRDRSMAHEGSRFLDGDVRGLQALRERDARYGKLRYFTFRDRDGRLWLFDYADDLRLLLQMTFDVVYANDRYLIARSPGDGMLQPAQRSTARLPGPDPRAFVGVDPRLVRAIVDFVGRERATLA